MKSNISNNLKRLMALANISEHELSRKTKIKQPIIHRLLSGENVNPKIATLKPISDYFMVTVSQLIGEKEIDLAWGGLTSKDHYGWSEVPLLSWDRLNTPIDNKLYSKLIVTDSKVSTGAFAVVMKDQSMEPIIPENCLIIVEPDLSPENGDFIVIKSKSNIANIRQLIESEGKKYVTPLNRKFGSIEMLSSGHCILGTVLRTIYDHKMNPLDN